MSDPRLDELAEAGDRLQKNIEGRLTDEARLRRFRTLRHDVGFEATPFSGSSADDRLRRTRAAVGNALRLFGLIPDQSGKPGLESPYFTKAEKKEIEEGCCELILELADADVSVTAAGYFVKSISETVPFGEALPSPDGHYWRCYWGGKRKCFFAPPGTI